MMWRIVLDVVVTATLLAASMWWAYRQGYRTAMRERLETLARKARHKANQATAEAHVLGGVLPPRIRRARIKGTSRRDLKD